jgi:hypothetical protein
MYDETLPTIYKPEKRKKGKYKENLERTHVREDK